MAYDTPIFIGKVSTSTIDGGSGIMKNMKKNANHMRDQVRAP